MALWDFTNTRRMTTDGSSSTVDWIMYDLDNSKMRIGFLSGRTYDYENVPRSVFGRLCAAESVGSEVNRMVTEGILRDGERVSFEWPAPITN